MAVRSATGDNSEELAPASWDVTEFSGKSAAIQIVDTATGGFGHILVDQIVQSDTNTAPLKKPLKMAPAKAERKLRLPGDLLSLPVGSPEHGCFSMVLRNTRLALLTARGSRRI